MHSRGSHGRRLPVPAGTFGPPARKGWDHEAACCRASTSARLSGSGRPRPSSSSLFLFTCWKVYTISEGLSRGNFCGARKIHFYGGRCLLAVGRNRPLSFADIDSARQALHPPGPWPRDGAHSASCSSVVLRPQRSQSTCRTASTPPPIRCPVVPKRSNRSWKVSFIYWLSFS